MNTLSSRGATRTRGFAKRMSAVLALVLAACIQGPWDYYPEHPADFRGVFATGYVLAGRPLTQFCFERILNLGEEHTQAFAWYDSADVRVSGTFSGQSRTVVLSAVSIPPIASRATPIFSRSAGGNSTWMRVSPGTVPGRGCTPA